VTETFSTRQRDVSSGQLFSSRYSRVAPSPTASRSLIGPAASRGTAAAPPAAPALTPVPAAAPVPLPEQSFSFNLTGQGQPAAAKLGEALSGVVSLKGRPGSAYSVTATLAGMPPIQDPAITPTLWLLHDLPVPLDLSPLDLAQLPHGPSGLQNQPGAVFTLDGNPPTYGSTSNTLTVAITPGSFTAGAGGTWQLNSSVDHGCNQAFHPLTLLGPTALPDIHTSIATGTLARILTDLFMRLATVLPQLPLRTHFGQRLAAIVQAHMTAQPTPTYLDPASFTRAAVTLEGLVRGTSRLMPTREGCILAAHQRTAG